MTTPKPTPKKKLAERIAEGAPAAFDPDAGMAIPRPCVIWERKLAGAERGERS